MFFVGRHFLRIRDFPLRRVYGREECVGVVECMVNVTVVHTLDEIPIQDTTEDEIFIMGGATLYNETIKIADTLYINLLVLIFPM